MKKETIQQVLNQKLQDPSKVVEIMRALESEEELAKAERVPAQKKQFVIVVSDPLGQIKEDLVGWVVQIDEESSPAVVLDRVHKSVYDFNVTKKGMKLPIETIGDAMEALPSTITKEKDLWIKTKTPVLVVATDNNIPLE